MNSLRCLYAMGIQCDPCLYNYTIVKNDKQGNPNNKIKCRHCVKENIHPIYFYYYGPRVFTSYMVNETNIQYNIECNNGHKFCQLL